MCGANMTELAEKQFEPQQLSTDISSGTSGSFIKEEATIKGELVGKISQELISIAPHNVIDKGPAKILKFEHLGESSADKSPFDILQQREDKKLRNSIEFLRCNGNPEYADTVAERLNNLLKLGYEDEPDQTPIVPESMNTFVNLLIHHHELYRPKIAITPNRRIQAKWRKDRNNKLVAEFMVDSNISFVLFLPAKSRPQKMVMLWGNLPWQEFVTNVTAHGNLDWAICDGRSGNPQ